MSCRQTQRDPRDHGRLKRQADKTLSMLIAANGLGCMNTETWGVCHAVNSRVADLRKRSHRITIKSEGHGVWRYRLEPPEPPAFPAVKEKTTPSTSITSSSDWYECSAGKPRPSADASDDLPFFSGVPSE